MSIHEYSHTEGKPLEVYASLGKVLLLLVGTVIFTLTGVWMIMESLAAGPGVAYLFLLLGVVCAGLFGLALPFYLYMLLRPFPLLVVDEQGIDDRSSLVPAGRLMWEEISDIQLLRYSRQKTISIHLVDPKAYLARQRGVKRWLMAVNRRLIGTPVNITGQAMNIPLERVFEEMERNRHHGDNWK